MSAVGGIVVAEEESAKKSMLERIVAALAPQPVGERHRAILEECAKRQHLDANCLAAYSAWYPPF